MSAQPTTTPPPAPAAASALGAPHPHHVSAWTCYRVLLRWKLGIQGPTLPVVIVVQAMLAAGVVIGFSFLIPGIDSPAGAATALFLSTGAPTTLIMIFGLVMVPQAVAESRADGTFTYMRSLPIPRAVLLAVDLTMWLAIALPGLLVSVVVASLRFDLSLSLDPPVLISTSLLVVIMSASVGNAIAVSVRPALSRLITQVLVFFVMLFSPVSFPASQLPQWLQELHDWLPVRPAADLLRAGLASQAYTAQPRDLLVLLVWAAAGLAITLRALTRRP